MPDDLPAPLVPSDVDLRDFAFMPLDVMRLRDSDLAASETPESCWAAVLLWAASWHQVPAGSIPNDERWIAKHAGYAQRGKIAAEWIEVQQGALRGFVKCSDGRLYHPVVSEKAREAWKGKLKQRHATECARIKKHNQRYQVSLPILSFEEWMSSGCLWGQALPVPRDKAGTGNESPKVVPEETASKGQGEGQGYISSSVPSDDIAPPRGARPPKASRLPADWQPDETDTAYAQSQRLTPSEIQREAEKFRDHWLAKGGADGRKADWRAAWRTWSRNAVDWRRTQSPPSRASPQSRYAGPSMADLANLSNASDLILRTADDSRDCDLSERRPVPADTRVPGYAGRLHEQDRDDPGGAVLDLQPAGGW